MNTLPADEAAPFDYTKVKAVDLKPDFPHLILFLIHEDNGWCFFGWKAAVGYAEPSQTDQKRRFATQDEVAMFFRKQLQSAQ